MSDTVLKIVPVDPSFVPADKLHAPALRLLEDLCSECWEPEVQVYPEVWYIDAGENEEGATCPRCGARLRFDFFQETHAETDWYRAFLELDEGGGQAEVVSTMPCCGGQARFGEVSFDWSAWARFELNVSNPDIDMPIPDEGMRKLEALLGCRLRQVWAHY